jgi:hypothetical protein
MAADTDKFVRDLTIDLDLLPKSDRARILLAPLHCHIEKEAATRPETGEVFTFSFSVSDLIDDRLSFLTDGFSVRVQVRFQR